MRGRGAVDGGGRGGVSTFGTGGLGLRLLHWTEKFGYVCKKQVGTEYLIIFIIEFMTVNKPQIQRTNNLTFNI